MRAHFRVLGDTTIAATVPRLRAGRQYWVAVVSPAGKDVSEHGLPFQVVRPGLLKQDFANVFTIRPGTVIPSGDSSFLIGKLFSTKRGHAVHWTLWTSTRAFGQGTVWIDNGIPNVAMGTFRGYPGSVGASRVRGGRFTRMTIHWKQSGRVHGQTLKLERDRSGWFWR